MSNPTRDAIAREVPNDKDALADAISTQAGHLNAATFRFLVFIAEFDRQGIWADQGAMTCAHWLSWACGIDSHTAREKVRVAHALDALPLMSECFSRGELSYSKVRSLTRVATPDNEADLLNIGTQGTAGQVDAFVRHFRRAVREEDTGHARAQIEERRLSHYYDDDGTFVLHGRFPPEMGERIWKAIEAAVTFNEQEQPAAEWDGAVIPTYPHDVPARDARARPSHGASRADALAWMCERLMEGADTPTLAAERHEIVVHVDVDVLSNDAPGRCHIEDGAALAAETARRLCCDGGIVTTVDGPDGEPLAVGRRTRSIPPSIRRALQSRDESTCRFPGCTSTHRLHGHHVQHWAAGGETNLDNLVLLCPYHHRLVHEGGFDVRRLDDGAFRFTTLRGWAIRPPTPAVPSTPHDLPDDNTARGIDIGPDTSIAKWHGGRCDYDQGVMALMAKREQLMLENGPPADCGLGISDDR